MDGNQPRDELGVVFAVAGEELVVGGLASLGPRAELVAREVELTRAEADVLEVTPERSRRRAHDVSVVRVAVNRLQRDVEAVDDLPRRAEPAAEGLELAAAERQRLGHALDLVEAGEVLEPRGIDVRERVVDPAERLPGRGGVELGLPVVLHEVPQRDEEAVPFVRPGRNVAGRGRRRGRPASCSRGGELELLLDPLPPSRARERHGHAGDDGARREVDEHVRQVAQDDRLLHAQAELARDLDRSFHRPVHSVGSTTCRG